MDRLFVHELRVDTLVGIYDWETRVKQTLVFDIEVCARLERAGLTDDLADTIDYGELARRVSDWVGGCSWNLLEHLAETVVGRIFDEFRPAGVRMRITKEGAVPAARAVGIEVVRGDMR